MILQNMLLQMLFGAMTGYITNDFAIEMLFEKRFGLGGVIPRTKAQFVDNISALVERDIITQSIIAEEIRKPEFDAAVGRGVKDFFDRAVQGAIPDGEVFSLPGVEDFVQNITDFADENLDLIMEQLTRTLDEHVNFDEILNEEQLRYGTEHGFDELMYALAETNLLEGIVVTLLKDIQDNEMQSLSGWIMAFIEENRSELEAMTGRAISSGLAKMGPMMAMLAGRLSFITASIPKDIIDYIADREKIEKYLDAKITEACEGEGDTLYRVKIQAVRRLKEKRNVVLAKAQSGLQGMIKELKMSAILEAMDVKSLIFAALEPEMLKVLLKDVNLRVLYEKVIRSKSGGEKIKDRTSETVCEYVRSNAGRLLSGRIREFVKNNLSRYSENEIKDVSRDFIGRNLKPIAYFGAFLGVITGFCLSFVSPDVVANEWARILIYMAAFGILGWATNFIAITMLFRPYRKYKLIPFLSPGYIMKNKPAFATSLGIFIEKEVLSGKIVAKWFSDGKEGMKARFGQRMAENDHEAVRKPLQNVQDELVHYAVDFEKNWLLENKEVTADKLTALIGQQEIKALLDGNQDRLADAIEAQIKNRDNAAAIAEAADAALDILAENLLDHLAEQETVEKMIDAIYKNVPMLQNIPFVSEAMIRQILSNVLQALITEELPGFWAGKSSQIRDVLIGGLNEKRIKQVIVYGKNNLHKQTAGQYLLAGEMRGGIAGQMQRLAESETFIQSETRSCNMILSAVTSHKTFLLGGTLLGFVTEQGAGAVVDTLERNIGEVLRSVRFAEITEEQVMKLDGRNIHKMFDSFMHKYFVSIRRYGFMGAVFGINTISSIGLMCAYWIWCIYHKIRKIRLSNKSSH